MNRYFKCVIFFLLGAGNISYCRSAEPPRFVPQESFRELTVGVGLHAPLKGDDFGSTECYVVDYAVYGYDGIGFHGGLKYIPEIRGISDCLEVPFKIAWRCVKEADGGSGDQKLLLRPSKIAGIRSLHCCFFCCLSV